ncbi:DUF4363 family protein [Xylanivirga thermophila]|jgi:uncharacterized protein YijF (DUF1287 family)|uniref:DUF4363 family protein n=1 Tax=Xylanivirga thermophila TaxID=2496273 RepID=UPI001FB1A2E1|nr:DUF4363 family protein [Xylanivirga thermophila]
MTPVILALILFIIFAWWAQWTLKNNAESMAKDIDKLEAAIKDDNWDMASNILEDMHKEWKNVKNKWQMLINHQEIDNIESTLAKVESYVKAKENGKEDALAEIATLKLFLLHIPDKEALRITNIL